VHRPDTLPSAVPEPLTIDRRVSPRVKALITVLLRHHDRVAHPSVSTVVLTIRDTEVQLKLTSDLPA
jgi:hypothetical protein